MRGQDTHASSDTANLGIGDGYGDPIFADYREEPPPAPKLNTPGIVATDITKVFREAASSQFAPQACYLKVIAEDERRTR